MKTFTKTRMVVTILVFTLIQSSFVPFGGDSVSRAASHTIQNPSSIADSTMNAGKRVTYDTVFLGSYPQSEVKSDDPVYAKLQATTNWDFCDDTVIDGTKYRRMKRSDATGCTMNLESWYYDEENDDYYSEILEPGIGADGYSHWEDEDTYHYFRYDPIRWRVLDTDGQKALLLSDIALDARATDIYLWTRPADPEDVLTIDGVRYQIIDSTWDNCELRSWLNSYDASHNYYKVNCSGSSERSFYNLAFSSEEKSAILTTHLTNEGGKTTWRNGEVYEYTVGGRDTDDKVFLLSYDDVLRKYGFSPSEDVADEAKKCNLSDYTISMGLYGESDNGSIPRDKWSVQWGLRTPTDGVSFHYGSDHYATVEKTGKRYIYRNREGGVYNYGDWVGRYQGVRPAMMIDVSSDAYTYAGTYCTNGTYSDGSKLTLEKDQEGNETSSSSEPDPVISETQPSNTPIVAAESPMPTYTPAPVNGGGGSGGSTKPAETVNPVATIKPSESPKPETTVTPSATPSAVPNTTPSSSPSPMPAVSSEPTSTPNASDSPENKDYSQVTSSGVTYIVSGKTATVKNVANKKKVRISKTVSIKDKTYRVTKLFKNMFKGKKKVRTVTLDVTYIKSVMKGAFDGIYKKAKICLIGKKTRIKKVLKMINDSGIARSVRIIG